jgi:mannose-6-phosphate isomerase-like protein (cupin superfamily)
LNGVDIYSHPAAGFVPAAEYGTWRVAFFSSDECWRAENLTYVQKHEDSDEVFALLRGSCTLFVSDEELPRRLRRVEMAPGVIYRIRRGVWHTHALGENTCVFVVEDRSTAPENSPKFPLPHPLEESIPLNQK